MIARIEGQLLKIDDETALVQVGQIGYEIMLPGYCSGLLADKVGTEITLSTIQYYEGSPGGGNLTPRVIGFIDHADKQFFHKFTSVKGMGIRKALRCLSIPIAQIASAIEQGDEKLLNTLPGIGKRMSQQIIAQLKGKLTDFATAEHVEAPSGTVQFKPFQAEALEILVAWGEKRKEAMELIELACKKHPDVVTAEELVPLVYRLKQGIEV